MSWGRSLVWAVMATAGFVLFSAVLDRQWPDRSAWARGAVIFGLLVVITVVERIVLAVVDARRARAGEGDSSDPSS